MTLLKLPGLIDPHVHLRTPGQTEKEDLFTGTSAALAGGFTTVIDMPNNKLPITTLERLNEKILLATQSTVCSIGFYFGSLGDNLEEFKKVQPFVKGLKLYLNETTGNFLIDTKTLAKIFDAWPNTTPILTHAEDDAVEEVINNVRRTGKHAHFCHISTASDLKQIMKAKEENLPISCGVTPHHLFLTDTEGEKLGPYGKMKPYLKSKKDVLFLWKHLSQIDIIESDHAPHTKQEKEGEIAPFGVPGLETTLPLLLTAVSENRLTIEEIIRLCHTNPSKLFFVPTDTNTYVSIDMNEKYKIQNENLFTKCKWSPFNNWEMTGKIKKVVINNKIVFKNRELLAKKGSGNILTNH